MIPAQNTLLVGAMSMVSSGIMLLAELALLIVALTAVRKSRPDASSLIAGASGVFLFSTLISPLAYAGLAATGGMSNYALTTGVLSLALSFVRAIGWALLIIGVIKLATPTPSNPY